MKYTYQKISSESHHLKIGDVLESEFSMAEIGAERLHDFFQKRCDALPEAVALICGSEHLTYGELDARANQLANYFVHNGIGFGNRVGILLERSVYTYVTLLAVLKSGAAFVPLDPSFPQDRITFIARDASLDLLVTTADFKEAVIGICCEVFAIDLMASAIARYEFAAGLNACLNRVNELITTATPDFVSRQDLATLKNLEEQFVRELATVRGREDAVEVKAAELEAHQFSPTTKLSGTVVIAPVSVIAGDNAKGQRINTTPILGDRIRLELDTSFTGVDQLITRLQATNFGALSGTSTFTPEGDLRFGGDTYSTGNNNNVFLEALSYSFFVGKNTQVLIEGYAGTVDDFADTVNSSLDGDGDSGALSNFGTHNPIYNLLTGSGIVVNQEFGENVELSLGYFASESNNPSQKNGLFNGPDGVFGQLKIEPSESFTLGLTYVNAYNADLTAGSNRANLRSALLSNTALLPTPVLEGLRGESLSTSSNSYGVEASYEISPRFVLGGWLGYTNTRILSRLGGVIPRGNLDIWNYAVTLGFPDLGQKGSLGGIIVGMEPKVTAVSSSLKSVIGKDPNTSYHIEAFYQYPLTDNIAITPGIIYLTAPDDNSRNAGSVIGVIRSTFSF